MTKSAEGEPRLDWRVDWFPLMRVPNCSGASSLRSTERLQIVSRVREEHPLRRLWWRALVTTPQSVG